ncbi:MAG TPA: hypothetical protein VG248_10905 [Caulobacteraceae bacterium]|jgi:hypothetical protein|nr:hypothetical protein [Caulobacteraceae bacterium]
MARAVRGLWLVIALAAAPAHAGPPYLTDDPAPTDTSHWEIYNYVQGLGDPAGLGGEGGLDLNYGAAKDLQLTAVLPLAWQNPNGGLGSGLRAGPGTIELAAKYRFLHQSAGSWTPDVSVFPRFFVPTVARFGTGRLDLLLPVWGQKDFGKWSVFAGGGYQIDPGAGQMNFWQGGIALDRQVTHAFHLGAELFSAGRASLTTSGYTTLDFASTLRLTPHWSLLASSGPLWEPGGGRGEVFYLSLKADY